MAFTIQGEVENYIVSSVKKDEKLAKAIARDFVDTIDLQALALYLVPTEVAVNLLMGRLQKDPDGTLADLKKLGQGKAVRAPRKAKHGRPARKAARKPGPKPAVVKKAKAPAKKKTKGTRKRLSPEQAAEVKQRIISFLTANPWASRRQIADTAGLSSMAVYTRLMGELRKGRKVISRGTKAKMVYALAGAKVPAAAKKAPAKKKAAAKKAPAKKAPARKKAPAKK